MSLTGKRHLLPSGGINSREAILGYLEAADKEGIELIVDPSLAELVQIAI